MKIPPEKLAEWTELRMKGLFSCLTLCAKCGSYWVTAQPHFAACTAPDCNAPIWFIHSYTLEVWAEWFDEPKMEINFPFLKTAYKLHMDSGLFFILMFAKDLLDTQQQSDDQHHDHGSPEY